MKLPWIICMNKDGSLQPSSSSSAKLLTIPRKYFTKIKCPHKLFCKKKKRKVNSGICSFLRMKFMSFSLEFNIYILQRKNISQKNIAFLQVIILFL